MLKSLFTDRNKILQFGVLVLLFLLFSILFFPYDIVSYYFLDKKGISVTKVSNKFLGMELTGIDSKLFQLSKLNVRFLPTGVYFSLKGVNGKIGYDGKVSLSIKDMKLGDALVIHDADGTINGTVKYDLKKMELVNLNSSGELEIKSFPFGRVTINCKGDTRFNCDINSPNIAGKFSGIIKNGILQGEFNGTIFGVERKGEKIIFDLKV